VAEWATEYAPYKQPENQVFTTRVSDILHQHTVPIDTEAVPILWNMLLAVQDKPLAFLEY
jgi:hypothetical protein